jgi:hypothetical protein
MRNKADIGEVKDLCIVTGSHINNDNGQATVNLKAAAGAYQTVNASVNLLSFMDRPE